MTSERWQNVSEAWEWYVALPPEQRPAWLERLRQSQGEVAAQLEALARGAADNSGWDEPEAALIATVDALIDRHRLTDAEPAPHVRQCPLSCRSAAWMCDTSLGNCHTCMVGSSRDVIQGGSDGTGCIPL